MGIPAGSHFSCPSKPLILSNSPNVIREKESVCVWESEIYGKRDQERERERKEEEWQYGEIKYLIYLPS